jgi:hypothetical protein
LYIGPVFLQCSISDPLHIFEQHLLTAVVVPYYANTDTVDVLEDNVVFPFLDKASGEWRLVRRKVLIHEHYNLGIALPKDESATLANEIDQSIGEVIERLRFRR